MSQRNSEYARQPRDLYETPAWVTRALFPHIPYGISVWEPACGNGKMANILREENAYIVAETDISRGHDFFHYTGNHLWLGRPADAIITNPPYGLAEKFVDHAIELMQPNQGIVAMLLSTDFDSAATRYYLFRSCRAFKKKVVLTKRIVWFKRTDGKKEAPSTNHAWYIWDWKNRKPPTIAYHYE